MWEKIMAFFMSIIAFFAALFGLGGPPEENKTETGSVVRYSNVSYGDNGERQLFDLALPKGKTGDVGLVLMIHGGAWIEGNKDGYSSAVDYIASIGYAAAAINYRYLSDSVSMNDILNDIDAALQKIKSKGSEHELNINRVLLTGSSAGAHLSMLYAYARKSTAPIAPAAVFSYSGPTDLSDPNFYVNNALGESTILQLMSWATGKSVTNENRGNADIKAALLAISPINYVDASTVPTAICHGKVDTIVPYSNATAIVEKFEAANVTYDFISYPNSNHDLGGDPDCASAADKLIHEYVATYLG